MPRESRGFRKSVTEVHCVKVCQRRCAYHALVPHRQHIPRPATRRLSLYLRELQTRLDDGQERVSSKDLGASLGLTDAQIRKDLALFGSLGQPGRGYQVIDLLKRLRQMMGRDQSWPIVVVGIGNIGRAITSYGSFKGEGFEIVGVFDVDPKVVGTKSAGKVVRPMSELRATIAAHNVRLGVMAVPKEAAQDVADALIAAGVSGILNFAPKRVTAPHTVSIVSVDFTVSLEQLAFQVWLAGTEENAKK
ncbi:MAG: redox-sensing transcriptional repressor Rex [Planctomycetota bacterium]|nr:MAG: redox-sensing transcriptional repressor Rex [Planctomycetota bacterium]